MDSTDFAIVMISGVLIIIVIFLFILFKIFGKKKINRSIVTLLPEITKVGSHESRPEKFVIRPQEIEVLEKEFRMAGDFQKMESGKEILMEKKEDTLSDESKITIVKINETMQSIDDNENLKLEDVLIEIRDVNKQKKTKKKSTSKKNLAKASKLKEKEVPEKKARKKPVRK